MSDRENCFQGRRVLFTAMGSCIALAVGIGHATSQTSEIDSYEAAVRSQSKAEALSFIKDFGSSHLVGDLIESLRPEVAQEVCTDLQGSGPTRARQACEVLRETLASQLDAQTAAIAPAAGAAVEVSPVPAGAATSPVVSSDDEAEDVQDADDTDDAGGVDPSAVPVASIAAVDPVSNSAVTSASVPSNHEPQGGQDAGVSNNAGDPDLFYIPVAAATPAGDMPVPASTSGVTSTSAQSAEEPRVGQGTSDTDKSDDINIILPSMSIGTSPASTSVPSGDEPDTSYAQSSSDQSSSDKSDTGKNAEEKAAEEKAAKEAEKAAKEAEKAAKEAAKEAEKAAKEAEKADKEKGGKGGKGKAGKDKGSG
jgi:hypothetical protein